MKKTKILLPLLLVLAMIITSIVIFTGTAGADTTNASYSEQSVTMSADYANMFIGTYGAPTVTPGDFEALALNLATNAPTTNMLYKLTLTNDVTLKSPVNIAVNEYTEVVIDLAGHKLTTECDGAAFVINGSGGTVRIIGQYTYEGEWAPVVYNQTSGELVKLTEGSDSKVFFRNLDIDMSNLKPGTSLVSLTSGELIINSCEVTYENASEGSMSMISASGGASVSIKNSIVDLSAATATTTAISLSGANGYFEKAVIKADRAIYSDATASNILSAATDIEAREPFVVDDSMTRVDILGGRITALGGKVITGNSDMSLVKFWYGDGEMVIVGEDPAGYAIQEDCEFIEISGAYLLTYTKVAYAMQTIATIGTEPVVATGDSVLSLKPNDTYTYKDSTVWIATALSDCELNKTNSGTAMKANVFADYNLGVIIDFNGYNLKLVYDNKNAPYGEFSYYFDGSNAEGKKGGIIFDAQGGGESDPILIRAQAKAGNEGANVYFTLVVTDCVFDFRTALGTKASFFFLANGHGTFSDCEFIYSAANPSPHADGTHYMLISHGNDKYPGRSSVRIVNTSFKGTGDIGSLAAVGTADPDGEAKTYIKGVEVDGLGALAFMFKGTTYVADSKISTLSAPFAKAGEAYVYDTEITTADGALTTSKAAVIFYNGEGKNVVYTNGNEISGNYSSEEGYILAMTETGVYKLLDQSMFGSVTLPAIYQDGMVIQRNKPINIRGYGNTEGSVVQVSLGGNIATATVVNGEWSVTLPAMEAAYNQTIRIVESVPNDNVVEIKNVNIGEVWVMAGQSNANLETGYLEDVSEYAELSKAFENLRIYSINGVGDSPALEAEQYGAGAWYTDVTPEIVKDEIVSAIGYVAAAKIAAELGDDVPVAIMHITRGSTKIKTWLDYETLKEVSPSAADEYDYYRNVVGSLPSSSHGSNAVGTAIYNSFIAPLKGFSVAGVMWYQGEGDADGTHYAAQNEDYIAWATEQGTYAPYEEDADNCYTEFFEALEKVFRRDFGNDENLPIYVMQLSPFTHSYTTEGVYNLKIEQYEMCKDKENTHLVSLATDGPIVGGGFFNSEYDPDIENSNPIEQGFVHPTRKSTVGIRVADLILANEYGIKYADVYTNPQPISAVAKNGVLTVTFDTDLEYFYGSSAQGFEVYNGTAWVKATGYIEGNKVILTAEGVTDMTRVRYGCGEMLMELRDGTVIEIWGKGSSGEVNYSAAGTTLTVTYNGVTYTIEGDTTDMIRSLDYGNITNASGVPLVIFALDIETVTE